MSNTKKIAYNTVTQILARVVTTVASLVAIAYLARYLGVEGFGQYTVIVAYLSLFGIFADFGFFLLQVREITKHPENERYIVGNIFGLKLVLSLIVFTIAYLVSLLVYDNPVITTGILIGTILQASTLLAQVPISAFQARLQMHKVALTNIIARLLYLGLILLAIRQDMGVVGVIWMAALANVFALAIQTAWVWKMSPIIPQCDFSYWKKFMLEAWPIGVVVILATIYFRVDTIMLSVMKGDWEVGIYGAPYKIIEVMLTIPTIFMSSVFPIITKALDDNFQKAQSIFRRAFDFMSLLAMPIAFGTVIVSTSIMVLISGPEFAASGPVLQLLIWAVAISFLGGVFNYSIIAAGKQRILVWPYLIATVFNIIANLFIIPHYSYMGAATTTVITELLVFAFVFYVTYKNFQLTPQLRVLAKSILSAAIMFGVLWWLQLPNIYINIGLGAAVYAVGILLTKAVDKNVVKEIIRPS